MTTTSLAELRDLVAAQGARLTAQEAANATLRARIDLLHARRAHPQERGWRQRRLASLALTLLIALVPLSLFAATPFNDLTGGVHDANIAAIYAAGITKGCVPDVSYCPADNVTRQEMASFLARTAGLDGHPAVANAATVGGYTPNGLVRAFGASNSDNATGGEMPIGQSTDVIVVPFTAPTSGFVLVTGAQSLFATGVGCPCRVGLQLRRRNADNTEGGESPVMVQNLETEDRQSGTVSWVFPVEAGPQTFVLYAYRIEGTAEIASRPALTGIFVPFGPTGATP